MASEQELNQFFKSVEKKAFLRARYQVRDDEAALDIVQDAMFKLADNYGEKPLAEITLLFQRILTNTILDWFRRKKKHNAIFTNLSDFDSTDGDESFNILEALDVYQQSEAVEQADTQLHRKQVLAHVQDALQKLPARQREAFLLRYWEEMDVAETASAMGCTVGSVKTHCSRATHALAKLLAGKELKL